MTTLAPYQIILKATRSFSYCDEGKLRIVSFASEIIGRKRQKETEQAQTDRQADSFEGQGPPPTLLYTSRLGSASASPP